MENRISVQVPVKNGDEPFRTFLRTVAAQDIQEKWELVIVDDGSDAEVEKEFHRELSLLPEHCSLKIVRMDPGGNRPAARNAALKASQAPVALLMDADLELPSFLLRRHLEIMDQSGADAVMGRRINAWSADSTPWQRWMDSRAMGFAPSGVFPWKYFITGNLSVKKHLLSKAGDFDVLIDKYGGEDTEMGYRLSRNGASFHWAPELYVNHLDNVTVRDHSKKMLEYGGSGLKYTLKTHPGTHGLLGSRWVEPVFSSPLRIAPVRAVVRVLIYPPLYRMILRYAERFGCPKVIFTYLSVGACLSGLLGRKLNI